MAQKIKIEVIITDIKTGNCITKLDGSEFLAAVKAPRTMFLQTAIDEYNELGNGNRAEMQTSVCKRGKWTVL